MHLLGQVRLSHADGGVRDDRRDEGCALRQLRHGTNGRRADGFRSGAVQAEHDDRREIGAPVTCETTADPLVERDQGAPLAPRGSEHDLVRPARETFLHDGFDVVPAVTQIVCGLGGQVLVELDAHRESGG